MFSRTGARDAQLPSDGLPFVDAVDEEGQDVDADEVDDEGAHVMSYGFSGSMINGRAMRSNSSTGMGLKLRTSAMASTCRLSA